MHLWDRFGSTVLKFVQLIRIFGRCMIIIANTSKDHSLVFVRLVFIAVCMGISLCVEGETEAHLLKCIFCGSRIASYFGLLLYCM